MEDNTPISMKDIELGMSRLRGWFIDDIFLVKEFKFPDFKKAHDFINNLAKIAEEENHHPDIYWFYNKIQLKLSTHRHRCLTRADFILAERIDKITV